MPCASQLEAKLLVAAELERSQLLATSTALHEKAEQASKAAIAALQRDLCDARATNQSLAADRAKAREGESAATAKIEEQKEFIAHLQKSKAEIWDAFLKATHLAKSVEPTSAPAQSLLMPQMLAQLLQTQMTQPMMQQHVLPGSMMQHSMMQQPMMQHNMMQQQQPMQQPMMMQHPSPMLSTPSMCRESSQHSSSSGAAYSWGGGRGGVDEAPPHFSPHSADGTSEASRRQSWGQQL